MTIRALIAGFGLSITLCTGALTTAYADVPGATDAYGAFAFSSQDGGRLLVREVAGETKLKRPGNIKTALCSDGQRLKIRFLHRQIERENSGRENSENFDLLEGSVFKVVGAKADPEKDCFVASEAMLAGSAALPVKASSPPGACVQREKFAALRGREVAQCWPFVRLGTTAELAFLEFTRLPNDVLASLVLSDKSRTIFKDYPAALDDGEFTWRVEDGGEFHPKAFHIVFALQRGDTFFIGLRWDGEGLYFTLLKSVRGSRFIEIGSGYQYCCS